MKSKVKVFIAPGTHQVKFSIDHQTFTLHTEPPEIHRLRWYMRQLRIALKRLAVQGA